MTTHLDRLTRVIALATFFAVIAGCIPIAKQWVNNPPLAEGVPKIERGRSTREDVLRYFGTPHVEAVGAEAKVSRRHPAIRSLDESADKPPYYEEIEHLLPYSSVTDDRIALVYFETRGAGAVAIIGPGGISVSVNRLLIFVNKHTGVVEEVFYKEEFRP